MAPRLLWHNNAEPYRTHVRVWDGYGHGTENRFLIDVSSGAFAHSGQIEGTREEVAALLRQMLAVVDPPPVAPTSGFRCTVCGAARRDTGECVNPACTDPMHDTREDIARRFVSALRTMGASERMLTAAEEAARNVLKRR